MKIYHAPNTRSVRIVWLCEELGLDYELEMFKLGDPSMRDPEYLKINPMARVPSLADGDVTIFESGAIVEYILTKHGGGRMRPNSDSADFPVYLQWLHFPQLELFRIGLLQLPHLQCNFPYNPFSLPTKSVELERFHSF